MEILDIDTRTAGVVANCCDECALVHANGSEVCDAAIEYARSKGKKVCADGWRPLDTVFARVETDTRTYRWLSYGKTEIEKS